MAAWGRRRTGEDTARAECVHILGVDLRVKLFNFPRGYVSFLIRTGEVLISDLGSRGKCSLGYS